VIAITELNLPETYTPAAIHRLAQVINSVTEVPLIPTFASFSALALAFSAIYLLLSTLGGNLASLVRRARSSGQERSPVPFEPGRFVQQEANRIGRHLHRNRTAVLIFCASFGSLLIVGRQDWWPELPLWVWIILTAMLIGFIAYVESRFFRLAIYRLRLNALREEHVVVADRLNEARARGNNVLHSIPMREGIIDHVVVGKKGIFAIQIVRPPSRKFTSVRLRDEMLIFAPQDVEKGILNIRKFTTPVTILSKRLTDAVGSPVKVFPIIVVTDCEVKNSPGKNCLLANPGSCIMFVGWNDPGTHLMDDEITAVNDWLMRRCQERPFRNWRPMAQGGDVGYI
jgi:hypothetical protein